MKQKPSLIKNGLLLSAVITAMQISYIKETSAQEAGPVSNETTAAAAPSTEETKDTKNDNKVERVEVVGSRIKRIAKEGTTAVKSVGKESMEKSANTSVSDTMRDSTMASYGAARETSGSNAAATATVGLRGLGDTRTLVLLNGHRLPKDPAAEAVDLNLIPQSAIERIEVLKDGASALYGSDALGGVINIITKKNFTGSEASVKLSTPEKPGGTSYDISLLTGLAGEKSDFIAVLGYNHTDKIFGKDRELTSKGLSATGTTGAWRDAGGTWTVQPGCPPDLIKPDPSGNGNRCYYRFNEDASIRPQISQLNLLTDYTYRLGSGVKLYNRNIVVHKNIGWNYAPTPGTFNTPSGTPTEPNARRVSYRFGEAGNRDNEDSELNFSTLFGAKGNLTSVWDYDVSAGYSEINRKNKSVSGYLDQSVLDQLIQNRTFDPLAPAGSRGDISPALTGAEQEASTKLLTFDTVVTGEIGEMEAGPIGIATGISVFNEKLKQTTDDKSAAGLIIGAAGSNEKGNRDVQSAFAEVAVPLTEKLEADVAARVDHYSDFGTSINPKLSAKYTLNPEVMFRASVGTGFKAPTLSELYSSSSEGYVAFIDRAACAANPAACEQNQYLVYGGGNKDLKEEKSFAANIGTVIQPISRLSFSLDAWYTKVSNIVGINYSDLTQAELNGVNPADYGVTVVRDSNGIIESITARNLNLQEEEISGVDFNTELVIMENLLGHQFMLNNDFSYIVFDKFEGFPGAGKRNVVGEWGMPHWRNNATFSLRNDISTYGITWRSIPGQNVVDREIDKKIADLNEFDLSASYKLSKSDTFGAGVKNVFDSKQPNDPEGGTGGAPEVNASLYDVNGRKFYLTYSKKF